jgi:hypothetical protein
MISIENQYNKQIKAINLSIGDYYLKGKCYWTNPKMGDNMAEYSLYKKAIEYATRNGVLLVL